MKRTMRWAMAVALVGAVVAPGVRAEDAAGVAKPLPTLRIKGKVESVAKDDPAAVLLKVTDRYGFQTPIYVSSDTQIMKGQTAATLDDVKTGDAVEVEYNFDINTAKRHGKKIGIESTETASTPAVDMAPVSAAVPATATEAAPAAPEAPAAAAPEAPAATEPATGTATQ